MNKVVTLGYAHRNAQATLDTLVTQGYHIVDIRLKPFSQKPGYNKEDLAAEYKQVYHHAPALGNLNYKSSSDYVALKNWEQGLQQLTRALSRAPLVLMCACQWIEDCHRFYITKLALEAIPGLQVEHLLQNDHAGMIKHQNALTPGRCSWVENGVQCSISSQERDRCYKCHKPVCELHIHSVYHWEKPFYYCPDCYDVYLSQESLY